MVMVAVCTKATKQGSMFFSFKKRKADLSYLKIKTVLEPKTVMSSSKTAVATPQHSDTQFILVYVYARSNVNAYIHIFNGSPVNRMQKNVSNILTMDILEVLVCVTELHNVCQ